MAIGILVVVLTVVVSTFLVVITKSAKVKVFKTVESEGNYALGVMERTIRGAKEIVSSCSENMDTISVIDQSDEVVVFACIDEGTGAGYLERDGNRLTSEAVVLDSCDIDCYPPGEIEKPHQVRVAFQLSQAEATSRSEEQATLTFQFIVSLRNY